jgi:hypothetical protein
MDAIELRITQAVDVLGAADAALRERDDAIADGLRAGKTAGHLAVVAKVSHSRVRQIAMERGIKLVRGRPKNAAPRNGGKP